MKIEGLTTIYKITNPNGAIYIGQTNDWSKRFKAYAKEECKNQKLLYNSLKKYGWKNHKLELLLYSDLKDSDTFEVKYIKEYNSYYKYNKLGLNLTKGGRGIIPSGYKFSEEGKKKKKIAMQKALGGIPRSEETKKKIGDMHRGKTISEKQKKQVADFFSIPLLQYSLQGEFIREWKSGSEAERGLNIAVQCIVSCANGHKKHARAGKYLFRHKTENYPLQIKPFKIKLTLEYAIIKVINLVNNEITICNGGKDFEETFNIFRKSLWLSLKKSNGLFKIKKLQTEVIGYGLPKNLLGE
jgi:group I intron endonuclease